MSKIIGKLFVSGTLFLFFILSSTQAAVASLVIQSQVDVHITLKGYTGLADTALFEGELLAGAKHLVHTPYQGLALLVFEKGQQYPLILGRQSFSLSISNPDTLPSFTGSAENIFFYKLLKGEETDSAQYDFPLLMIEAKQLLEATHSVRTEAELVAMKEAFHTFVRTHYQDLQRSDMLMRLIAQYFMMHEYVDYHVQGAPAADIRKRYEKAVMDGVQNWLDILKPHIAPHEIVNYVVSLYYNRSMVTLASRIIEQFRETAYCPGVSENISFDSSDDPLLSAPDGSRETTLHEVNGRKIIAFVSNDCPVSMVETVIKARRLAQQTEPTLIVAPLEPLSSHHLAMRKLVSGANMLFIDDEKWRKEKLPEKLKLPRFVEISS